MTAASPSIALNDIILQEIEPTKIDSIGFFHNYIISYSNFNNIPHISLTKQNIKNSLSNVISANYGSDAVTDYLAYDNNQNLLLKVVIPSINSYQSIDDFFDAVENYYPNESWIPSFKVFVEVIASYGGSMTKADFLDALQIVNSSSIPITEKVQFRKALYVAYASYVLWS